MSDRIFRLDFFGEVAEGTDIASVKASLQDLLKTDEERVLRMFSSGPATLKNDIDHETALNLKAMIDKASTVSTI